MYKIEQENNIITTKNIIIAIISFILAFFLTRNKSSDKKTNKKKKSIFKTFGKTFSFVSGVSDTVELNGMKKTSRKNKKATLLSRMQ